MSEGTQLAASAPGASDVAKLVGSDPNSNTAPKANLGPGRYSARATQGADSGTPSEHITQTEQTAVETPEVNPAADLADLAKDVAQTVGHRDAAEMAVGTHPDLQGDSDTHQAGDSPTPTDSTTHVDGTVAEAEGAATPTTDSALANGDHPTADSQPTIYRDEMGHDRTSDSIRAELAEYGITVDPAVPASEVRFGPQHTFVKGKPISSDLARMYEALREHELAQANNAPSSPAETGGETQTVTLSQDTGSDRLAADETTAEPDENRVIDHTTKGEPILESDMVDFMQHMDVTDFSQSADAVIAKLREDGFVTNAEDETYVRGAYATAQARVHRLSQVPVHQDEPAIPAGGESTAQAPEVQATVAQDNNNKNAESTTQEDRPATATEGLEEPGDEDDEPEFISTTRLSIEERVRLEAAISTIGRLPTVSRKDFQNIYLPLRGDLSTEGDINLTQLREILATGRAAGLDIPDIQLPSPSTEASVTPTTAPPAQGNEQATATDRTIEPVSNVAIGEHIYHLDPTTQEPVLLTLYGTDWTPPLIIDALKRTGVTSFAAPVDTVTYTEGQLTGHPLLETDRRLYLARQQYEQALAAAQSEQRAPLSIQAEKAAEASPEPAPAPTTPEETPAQTDAPPAITAPEVQAAVPTDKPLSEAEHQMLLKRERAFRAVQTAMGRTFDHNTDRFITEAPTGAQLLLAQQLAFARNNDALSAALSTALQRPNSIDPSVLQSAQAYLRDHYEETFAEFPGVQRAPHKESKPSTPIATPPGEIPGTTLHSPTLETTATAGSSSGAVSSVEHGDGGTTSTATSSESEQADPLTPQAGAAAEASPLSTGSTTTSEATAAAVQADTTTDDEPPTPPASGTIAASDQGERDATEPVDTDPVVDSRDGREYRLSEITTYLAEAGITDFTAEDPTAIIQGLVDTGAIEPGEVAHFRADYLTARSHLHPANSGETQPEAPTAAARADTTASTTTEPLATADSATSTQQTVDEIISVVPEGNRQSARESLEELYHLQQEAQADLGPRLRAVNERQAAQARERLADYFGVDVDAALEARHAMDSGPTALPESLTQQHPVDTSSERQRGLLDEWQAAQESGDAPRAATAAQLLAADFNIQDPAQAISQGGNETQGPRAPLNPQQQETLLREWHRLEGDTSAVSVADRARLAQTLNERAGIVDIAAAYAALPETPPPPAAPAPVSPEAAEVLKEWHTAHQVGSETDPADQAIADQNKEYAAVLAQTLKDDFGIENPETTYESFTERERLANAPAVLRNPDGSYRVNPDSTEATIPVTFEPRNAAERVANALVTRLENLTSEAERFRTAVEHRIGAIRISAESDRSVREKIAAIADDLGISDRLQGTAQYLQNNRQMVAGVGTRLVGSFLVTQLGMHVDMSTAHGLITGVDNAMSVLPILRVAAQSDSIRYLRHMIVDSKSFKDIETKHAGAAKWLRKASLNAVDTANAAAEFGKGWMGERGAEYLANGGMKDMQRQGQDRRDAVDARMNDTLQNGAMGPKASENTAPNASEPVEAPGRSNSADEFRSERGVLPRDEQAGSTLPGEPNLVDKANQALKGVTEMGSGVGETLVDKGEGLVDSGKGWVESAQKGNLGEDARLMQQDWFGTDEKGGGFFERIGERGKDWIEGMKGWFTKPGDAPTPPPAAVNNASPSEYATSHPNEGAPTTQAPAAPNNQPAGTPVQQPPAAPNPGVAASQPPAGTIDRGTGLPEPAFGDRVDSQAPLPAANNAQSVGQPAAPAAPPAAPAAAPEAPLAPPPAAEAPKVIEHSFKAATGVQVHGSLSGEDGKLYYGNGEWNIVGNGERIFERLMDTAGMQDLMLDDKMMRQQLDLAIDLWGKGELDPNSALGKLFHASNGSIPGLQNNPDTLEALKSLGIIRPETPPAQVVQPVTLPAAGAPNVAPVNAQPPAAPPAPPAAPPAPAAEPPVVRVDTPTTVAAEVTITYPEDVRTEDVRVYNTSTQKWEEISNVPKASWEVANQIPNKLIVPNITNINYDRAVGELTQPLVTPFGLSPEAKQYFNSHMADIFEKHGPAMLKPGDTINFDPQVRNEVRNDMLSRIQSIENVMKENIKLGRAYDFGLNVHFSLEDVLKIKKILMLIRGY